jgi:replicative DNA helicase
MNILSDPSSERAVLAILCQHGEQPYLDVCDLISEETFTIDSNIILYRCIKNIFQKPDQHIDIASILASAHELQLDHLVSKKEELQHLKAILDFPARPDNLLSFASKIKKLEIARKLHRSLADAQSKILDVNGSESISSIISLAEEPVLNFSTSLDDTDNKISPIANGIEDYIQNLIDNPIDQVGISTGFPAYDFSIGGGLRPSTINVIAARPKTGKTLLSDNMGFHIAHKLKIPVLNMDTEMTKNDHIHRLLAMMTEVEISKIETGKFAESPMQHDKIKTAINDIKNMPLYHKSIAGKSFDEQLSIMRRWIIKTVGLNADGSAKPCVIFYDYLKLMDSVGISQDMKEYQVLGFMMTSLHNFACQYKIPVVAFVQLNRDGITKESTDTASGSDRIIWLCSNFTIFKRKSDEEIAEDGPNNGNRKLVPLISRHGAGLDDNDYINCHMKGFCAKITEGKTRLELVNKISSNEPELLINDDQEIQLD